MQVLFQNCALHTSPRRLHWITDSADHRVSELVRSDSLTPTPTQLLPVLCQSSPPSAARYARVDASRQMAVKPCPLQLPCLSAIAYSHTLPIRASAIHNV
jgi:hypothetical protein